MQQDILINALKFLNRDELERISPNSHFLNAIVKSQFSSSPFRVIDSFLNIQQNQSGDLELSLWKNNDNFHSIYDALYLNPSNRQWVETFRFLNFSFLEFKTFLNKSVRITDTFISIYSTPYKNEDIENLEEIASIWTGLHLELWCHSYNNDMDIVRESMGK